MKAGIQASLLMLMACVPFPAVAAALSCREAFYSPADINHEHPLPKPSGEFLKSYKQAKAGNAMEQRNIAVSYDAGYLVAACPEKARYWYRKAADGGDPVAQKWVGRDDRLQEIADGPEFALMERSTVSGGQVKMVAAAQAEEAEGNQHPHSKSAEEMLADITRPPDASSDLGKMIEAGRLLGSMLGGR